MGKLIDQACILWQTTDCGKEGACFKYDNTRFRYTLHGVPLVTLSLAAVCYFVGFMKCEEHNLLKSNDLSSDRVDKNDIVMNSLNCSHPKQSSELSDNQHPQQL